MLLRILIQSETFICIPPNVLFETLESDKTDCSRIPYYDILKREDFQQENKLFSKDRFCGKNVLYLVLFMQCFYYVSCVTNQYKRDAVWMEFFSKEKLGWQHLKN